MARTAGSVKADAGLAAGESGTLVTFIEKGTVSVDLGNITAGTSADTSVTVTGAATGDTVVMCPPATAMTTGLVVGQAWVSAADTVKIRVYNESAGDIDEAAADWTYLIIRS